MRLNAYPIYRGTIFTDLRSPVRQEAKASLAEPCAQILVWACIGVFREISDRNRNTAADLGVFKRQCDCSK
jgi:hypothetical protein